MFFEGTLRLFSAKMRNERFFVRFWICTIAFCIMMIITNVSVLVGYGEYAYTNKIRNVGDLALWTCALLALGNYHIKKKDRKIALNQDDAPSVGSAAFIVLMFFGSLGVPVLSPINSVLCAAIAIVIIYIGVKEIHNLHEAKMEELRRHDPDVDVESPS